MPDFEYIIAFYIVAFGLYWVINWFFNLVSKQESWQYYAVLILLSLITYLYASSIEIDEDIRTQVIVADIAIVWLLWGLVGIGFQLYLSRKFSKLLTPLKQGKYKFKEVNLLAGFTSIYLRATAAKSRITLRISGDYGKFVVKCTCDNYSEVEWEFNANDDVTTMTDSIYTYLDHPHHL